MTSPEHSPAPSRHPLGAVVVIIPARLASTRFPRKVLADQTGAPLIRHVYDAASRATRPSRVVIATDADEVARAAAAFGAPCVMTSEDHPNGTSRLAEAAAALALNPNDIVVNVQGDEPELDPGAIDAVVAALELANAPMATVASPLGARADGTPDPERARADLVNPAIVKVVLARDSTALYFSRAPIPHDRDGLDAAPPPAAAPATSPAPPPAAPSAPARPLRHIGLYAYRTRFLARYVTMEPTPLERTEMLEQLRVLEHGERIAVAIVPAGPEGIDTPEQYDAFVRRHAQRTQSRE
jgi:3-deoxy-manno-octulosonate cytidylyltransferase (CMP-KDO synthetase)